MFGICVIASPLSSVIWGPSGLYLTISLARYWDNASVKFEVGLYGGRSLSASGFTEAAGLTGT